jgi:hypothetical protein
MVMAQHTERGDAMSKQWQYRPGFGWVERDARQLEDQRDARDLDAITARERVAA